MPAGNEPKVSRRGRWEKGSGMRSSTFAPFGLRWRTFAWLANRSSFRGWKPTVAPSTSALSRYGGQVGAMVGNFRLNHERRLVDQRGFSCPLATNRR